MMTHTSRLDADGTIFHADGAATLVDFNAGDGGATDPEFYYDDDVEFVYNNAQTGFSGDTAADSDTTADTEITADTDTTDSTDANAPAATAAVDTSIVDSATAAVDISTAVAVDLAPVAEVPAEVPVMTEPAVEEVPVAVEAVAEAAAVAPVEEESVGGTSSLPPQAEAVPVAVEEAAETAATEAAPVEEESVAPVVDEAPASGVPAAIESTGVNDDQFFNSMNGGTMTVSAGGITTTTVASDSAETATANQPAAPLMANSLLTPVADATDDAPPTDWGSSYDAGSFSTTTASDANTIADSTAADSYTTADPDRLSVEVTTWTELKTQCEAGGVEVSLADSFAGSYPGEIVLDEGSTCVIRGNGKTLDAKSGGRIFKVTGTGSSGTVLTIHRLTLENGLATDFGGAIYAYGADVEIFSSEFKTNEAPWGGGAIQVDDGSLLVHDSSFQTNRVASSQGGAILVDQGGCEQTCYLKIFTTTFESNQAGSNGGAVYAMNANVEIHASEFKTNAAVLNGGAIQVSDPDRAHDVQIYTSAFESNQALNGGAIYATADATVAIYPSTFGSNGATQHGDDVYSGDDVNVLFKGCSPASGTEMVVAIPMGGASLPSNLPRPCTTATDDAPPTDWGSSYDAGSFSTTTASDANTIEDVAPAATIEVLAMDFVLTMPQSFTETDFTFPFRTALADAFRMVFIAKGIPFTAIFVDLAKPSDGSRRLGPAASRSLRRHLNSVESLTVVDTSHLAEGEAALENTADPSYDSELTVAVSIMFEDADSRQTAISEATDDVAFDDLLVAKMDAQGIVTSGIKFSSPQIPEANAVNDDGAGMGSSYTTSYASNNSGEPAAGSSAGTSSISSSSTSYDPSYADIDSEVDDAPPSAGDQSIVHTGSAKGTSSGSGSSSSSGKIATPTGSAGSGGDAAGSYGSGGSGGAGGTAKSAAAGVSNAWCADSSGTADASSPCVFPFIYEGVTYSECTDINHPVGALWCASAVSSDGEYTGEWGECEPCPTAGAADVAGDAGDADSGGAGGANAGDQDASSGISGSGSMGSISIGSYASDDEEEDDTTPPTGHADSKISKIGDAAAVALTSPISDDMLVLAFTGEVQHYVVPKGVTHVFVKLWGAGGAGGGYVQKGKDPWYSGDSGGGGGGFTQGRIDVKAGQKLEVVVGGGGKWQTGKQATKTGSARAFGGGGRVGHPDFPAGGGGGRSAIQIGGMDVATAGGGGGGGRGHSDGYGGGGGGLVGGSAFDTPNGQGGGGGGSQTAKGIGGLEDVVDDQHQGKHSSNPLAGGGGGGYFGGGSVDGSDKSGGGGSGYIGGLVEGDEIQGGHTFAGDNGGSSHGGLPAKVGDKDLLSFWAEMEKSALATVGVDGEPMQYDDERHAKDWDTEAHEGFGGAPLKPGGDGLVLIMANGALNPDGTLLFLPKLPPKKLDMKEPAEDELNPDGTLLFLPELPPKKLDMKEPAEDDAPVTADSGNTLVLGEQEPTSGPPSVSALASLLANASKDGESPALVKGGAAADAAPIAAMGDGEVIGNGIADKEGPIVDGTAELKSQAEEVRVIWESKGRSSNHVRRGAHQQSAGLGIFGALAAVVVGAAALALHRRRAATARASTDAHATLADISMIFGPNGSEEGDSAPLRPASEWQGSQRQTRVEYVL
jgi:predicted outer membrane repeat protein